MRSSRIFMPLLALLVVVALPALGGEKVTLTGWVSDTCCGARNASPEGKDCTIACNKAGKALTIYADGTNYQIDDQKAAKKHIGYKVVVKGSVSEDGVLHIDSIEPAEKKKKKA